MRQRYESYAGPSTPSAALPIPRQNAGLHLLTAAVSFRRGAGPLSPVKCRMLVTDGAGSLVRANVGESMQIGVAGSTISFIFQSFVVGTQVVGSNELFLTDSYVQIPISDQIWIQPQAQLTFQLGGGVIADDVFLGVNLTTWMDDERLKE